MGQYLSKVHESHANVKRQINIIPCELASKFCKRWKELGIPFFVSVNEFKKNIIQSDDVHLNFEKFIASDTEIEVLEFLTSLLVASKGTLENKLKCKINADLFEFYQFEDENTMTPDEFYVCIDKTLRAICNEGHIQLPYIEMEPLEDFRDEICKGESINFDSFKKAVIKECEILAKILQESHNFLRTLSTHIIENPYPVISYLQPGNLFLGKYEIIKPPEIIEEISSTYKRKYKHAILNVKAMIGEELNMKFELIYLAGVYGDKSFRQNYFREIVLKNKLTKEEVQEFGELPGGILYKSINELEATQMTLEEYLDIKIKETKDKAKPQPNQRIIVCMNELEAIDLGLNLLDQLEILHSMKVLHSNINPSSVYLLEQDIQRLCFLDLELAIWDPVEILGSESQYFQQLSGDKYDTTFRDENYLSPEHKEFADEYKRTGKIPKHNITEQCDIYSIGAIIYKALTGNAPVTFSEDMANHPGLSPYRDLLDDWECPKSLDSLIISNGMAHFLIRILAKDVTVRHKDIKQVKDELERLKAMIERIPKPLLKGLEHVPHHNVEMFEDNFVLDLHDQHIDDFCLEYIYKFIPESNIPNIRIFGDVGLPIRALRNSQIEELSLASQNIYAEELKLLSIFIKVNKTLLAIDLSKNPLLQKRLAEGTENEGPESSNEHATTDLGFSNFLEALTHHSHLKRFEFAQVELGPNFAEQLCKPISANRELERLNMAGCGLGVLGVKYICQMCETMSSLRYVNLSSNAFGNEGAMHVAKLLETNHHILEIDLFRNNIGREGGEAIGWALTNNFIIQKLSIGDNEIDQNEKDLILQSVMFNTQYKKLKATNERFGEFGYNLMAESIKRWTEKSKFVLEKLRARLHQCEDEIDQKLAELLLDKDGNLNLQPASLQLGISGGEFSAFSFDSRSSDILFK